MTLKKLLSRVHDKVSHTSHARPNDQGNEADKTKSSRLAKWRTSKRLDSALLFSAVRTPSKQPPPQDDHLDPFHSGILEIPSPDWHHSRSKAPIKIRSMDSRLSAEFNQEKKSLAFSNRRPFSYSPPKSNAFVGVPQVIDALRLPISPRPSSDHSIFHDTSSIGTATSTPPVDPNALPSSPANPQSLRNSESYFDLDSDGSRSSSDQDIAISCPQRQSVPSFSVYPREHNSVRESATLPNLHAANETFQATPAPCPSKEAEDLCVRPRPHSFTVGRGPSARHASFRRKAVTPLASWSEGVTCDEPDSWGFHSNRIARGTAKENDGTLQRRLDQTLKALQKSHLDNERLREQVQDLQVAVLASEERAIRAESESSRLEQRLAQMDEESDNLRKELDDLAAASKESTHAMLSKNQQLEEKVRRLAQEANTSADENRRLRKHLKKSLAEEVPLCTPDSESASTASSHHDQQDELLRMHTRAQLGLIEYLEGESDVASAMARFKKQLEAEVRDLFGGKPDETDLFYETAMDAGVFGLGQNTRSQSYPTAEPMR